MKAWKVGDVDHHIGWVIFRARTRSAAKYMYIRGFLDDSFSDFPKLFAWRYPHADTDDDQQGEIEFHEYTKDDQKGWDEY